MSENEKEKHLVEERSLFIVKNNELIQKTRYSLSLQETRLLYYLISKIKPEDEKILEQKIEIRDFCEVCGINLEKSPEMYEYIKKAIKDLADRSFWIKTDKDIEVLLRWIDKAKINKRTGIVDIKLNEQLTPYLLQIKENYTQFTLLSVLPMKSKYSARIYELCRAELFRGHRYKEVVYDIEDLQKKIGISENSTYAKNFSLFHKTIIDKSINEIGLYTDITVEVEYIKEGRKYKKIKFIIRQLKDDKALQNQFMANRELNKRGGKE